MNNRRKFFWAIGATLFFLVVTPFIAGVLTGVHNARHPCEFDLADLKREIHTDQSFLKMDYCGGDTPEETAHLFTAALRANDFNLAIRYSVPGGPYPERYAESLSRRHSSSSTIYFLHMLDALVLRGEKKCRQEQYFTFKDAPIVEICEMGFVNDDGADKTLRRGHASLSMIKNPYTKKWQIYLEDVVANPPHDISLMGQ